VDQSPILLSKQVIELNAKLGATEIPLSACHQKWRAARIWPLTFDLSGNLLLQAGEKAIGVGDGNDLRGALPD
jgi:hypothetical protein